MIKISAGFVGGGDVKAFASEQRNLLAAANRAGVAAATEGLKTELRQQIVAAGLGTQLGHAIGANVYPRGGQGSMDAAGFVFPRGKKALAIFTSFNEAAVIQSPNGKKLAIPTQNATLGGRGGKRPSPDQFQRQTGIKLRVAPTRRPGVSLLVGPRLAGKVRGSQRDTLVYFILVPLARNRRRLSFDALAEKWAERVPDLIEQSTPQGL